MATRFYLPSTGTAYITPAFNGNWEDTSIAARRPTKTTKQSTAMTTVSFADANAANRDVLFRQFISDPIASQTIASQTVKFQIRAKERATTCNMFTTIHIYVIDIYESVVGTLLSITRDGNEANATTLTNRQFSATSSALAVSEGNRIVIEIGMGGDPDTGSDHDSDMRFGDTAASDLAEDDTSTSDDNPWVEFATGVTMLTPSATSGFTDNFDDNSIDTAKWVNWGGSNIVETGGKLELNTTANSATYYGIDSLHLWDLTGGSVAVKVSNAGNQAQATLECYPVYLIHTNDYQAFWLISGGNIYAYKREAGTNTSMFSTAYNSSTHAYFRIRESSGTLYYETSSDGSSWTTRHSVANFLPVNAFMVELLIGTYGGTETPATKMVIDTFNVFGTAYSTELTEVVTVVDTVVKMPGKVLTDVATIVDTIVKAPAKVLVDVVTLVDTFTRTWTAFRTFVEEITLVDTVVKQTNKVLTDVVTVVDSVIKSVGKVLTDVVTLVDTNTIQQILARTYTETVTLVDTVIKQTTKTLTDVVTLVDEFTYKIVAKILVETVTLVDTVVKQTTRVFTETVTLVDTVLKQVQRTFTEVVTMVDTITANAIYYLELTEVVTLVDSVIKTGTKVLTETVALVDTMVRQSYKVLTETVTLVDTIVRSMARTFVEAVTVVDSVVKTTARTLTDPVALTDTLVRTTERTLTEVLTLVDTLVKQTQKTLTEAITLSDTVLKTASKVLSEVVTATDSLVRGFYATYTETVALTDTVIKQLSKTLTDTVTVVDTFVHQLITKTKKGVTVLLSKADNAVTALKRAGKTILGTLRKDRNMVQLKRTDKATLPSRNKNKTIL